MKPIILASQSPRRRELLTAMGVEYEVIPSSYDEHLDDSRSTEEVAIELALGKAMDVAKDHPDAYVIGSDTIVTIDGRQLGKPVDDVDAKRMLLDLSGRENYVTTGVAVICMSDNVRLTGHDTATVWFKEFDEREVDAYIATGDPVDKAGAYSVQKLHDSMITKIEGGLDTIVGLPTTLLAEMLNGLGIDAQPAEYKLQ